MQRSRSRSPVREHDGTFEHYRERPGPYTGPPPPQATLRMFGGYGPAEAYRQTSLKHTPAGRKVKTELDRGYALQYRRAVLAGEPTACLHWQAAHESYDVEPTIYDTPTGVRPKGRRRAGPCPQPQMLHHQPEPSSPDCNEQPQQSREDPSGGRLGESMNVAVQSGISYGTHIGADPPGSSEAGRGGDQQSLQIPVGMFRAMQLELDFLRKFYLNHPDE